jgi:SAM-dependent methyltransferase
MKKHLFYTFLSVFLVTALITILGVTKTIVIEEFYLKGLFGALIIELIGALVGLFKNTDFFPEDKIRDKSIQTSSSNSSTQSIAESTEIGRGGYMRRIAEEIAGAKEEIIFTSRTMAQASLDPAQKLIVESCVKRASLGEIKHKGIVCANPETALGAISLKREADHVEIAFIGHQLELLDMSYFIVDRKRVIIGIGREMTKISFLLESKALAHLLLSHFDHLWKRSLPMRSYLEKTFQDAYLEVGEKAALEIVGFSSSEEFRAWINALPSHNSEALTKVDHRFDTPTWRLNEGVRSHLTLIVNEALQGGELSNERLLLLITLVQNAEKIDYAIHAYSFLYLYYIANYYKTRFSLSRGIEKQFPRNSVRILDLGCGSGASTLGLNDWFRSMYNNSNLCIDAVDVSKRQLGLFSRIVDETDLFSGIQILMHNQDAIEYLSAGTCKYDLILDGNFICELDKEKRLKAIDLIKNRLHDDGVLLVIERNSSGVHEELKSSNIFSLLSQEVIGPLDIPSSDWLNNTSLTVPTKKTYTTSFSAYSINGNN